MYAIRPVSHAEILRASARQRTFVPSSVVLEAADAVERATIRNRVLVAMLRDIRTHLAHLDAASAMSVFEETRSRGFRWDDEP